LQDGQQNSPYFSFIDSMKVSPASCAASLLKAIEAGDVGAFITTGILKAAESLTFESRVSFQYFDTQKF